MRYLPETQANDGNAQQGAWSKMPVVNIQWIQGRTVEQKRVVTERVTQAMQEVGVDPQSLYIVFEDVSKENFAINGTLFSDK
jgi:4-oxalocrotonate tautomerase